MDRYFFYLIILNMLVNVFAFVPNILFEERFEGAFMAMIVSVVIGFLLLFVFTSAISKFQQQGMPEILELFPKWLRLFILLLIAMMWFAAGAVTLLAFTNVTIRFLNPDFSGIGLISIYMIIVLFLTRLKSDSLLYTLEMVLIINLPLVVIILYQAVTHEYMSWDSIKEAGTHLMSFPSWKTIAASTFVLSGYTNLIIFNRVFKKRINLKRLWILPIFAAFNLGTSFFIPIGLWGVDGVGELTYPWIATADTLGIEFGPVERVISFFLIFYVSISILSVSIHWHVASEVMKSMFNKKANKDKSKNKIQLIIFGTFFLVTLFLEYHFRERDILAFGELWLNIRFSGEIILVLTILFLVRRKKV